MNAYFSPCRTWRYSLTREVDSSGEGVCTFIGLNPSTADETQDDPTVRRCIRYARDWGYRQLKMTNLYAFRSTDPKGLRSAEDPVGPENDHILSLIFGGSDMIIAAWGVHALPDRLSEFANTFAGWRFHALGLTKAGAPRHPLYLKADAQPFVYQIPINQIKELQSGT